MHACFVSCTSLLCLQRAHQPKHATHLGGDIWCRHDPDAGPEATSSIAALASTTLALFVKPAPSVCELVRACE